MKKFLSVAVALGMVAGVAATASALELKVKGKYVADGFYINSGFGIYGVAPWDLENTTQDFRRNFGIVTGVDLTVLGEELEPSNDDWYQHTFRIDPTLIVNDKVQVKSDIRLVDSNSVWGSQDDLQRFNGDGLRVNKLWLLYDSPIGRWEVGRRPAGAWMGAFINSGTAADRIMLRAPKMDNFKGYAFLQKSTERDAYTVNQLGFNPLEDNADNDYYEVAGAYVSDMMNIWVGIGTQQDSGLADIDMWRLKSAGDFTIGGANKLYYEFDIKTGEMGANDTDIQSSAFIAGWKGNFGNVSAHALYAYISGDNSNDNEAGAYSISKGMGADFQPLYILTGQATNVLNGDRGANLLGTQVRTAGAHAIVALADFKVSEDLTLHGGLGWGQADEAPAGWDDAYGWELDAGLSYKLYQNLTYDIHFGWWAVGDFAQMGMDALETKDIILLSHHLSMKF
jgi:hypothetical protein